jgi:hypothetical protein
MSMSRMEQWKSLMLRQCHNDTLAARNIPHGAEYVLTKPTINDIVGFVNTFKELA